MRVSTETVRVRVPENLLAKVREKATAEERSISEVIRNALRREIRERAA